LHDREESEISPPQGTGYPAGTIYAQISFKKGLRFMTKSLDVITDVIRNTKHPFRQVDDRPDKPTKHRYERRKIKEYLKLGDWTGQAKT
jgi:hypothetical protein